MQMPGRVPLCCCLCILLLGCASSLQLRRIEAAHRKPSNVAVFFSVETDEGDPVAALLASDFRIYEDGKLVSVDESRQTILNPEIAAAHYTLLLVDMSASVTASDQVERIVRAADEFIKRIEAHQHVAVYAFDGSKALHEISPFTTSGTQARRSVERLADFHTRDPSTNLHGGVVRSLDLLDKAVARSKVPLRFGTLVVFTDGTDRAARVSFQEMIDRIEVAEHELFAIGVGNEIDDATLSRIGRSGYIRVDDDASLVEAFSELGERIVRFKSRYYLLSYCSPARAGQHAVRVEARTEDAEGQLEYSFDARGFDAGCDPMRPPPFDVAGRTARGRARLQAEEP